MIREMLPEAHSSERGEGGGGNKEEQPDRIHRPDEMVIWVFFFKLSAFICTCEN